MYRGRVDYLTLVGLGFLALIFINVLSDRGWFSGIQEAFNQPVIVSADASNLEQTPAVVTEKNEAKTQSDQLITEPMVMDNPDVLAWPYENYFVTQGPHGMSYGHMAIDLSAGKGATIISPINGEVTELYVDQYGNPTLILENSRYKILMLHGIYTLQVGQRVAIGQPVGTESNIGYTLDANGRICTGRDCGYHTHLNIFDKQLGTNVNPLEVLPR